METKKCCRCKQKLNVKCFKPHKTRKDGLQSQCIECQKVYRREHYLANRAKYIKKAKINRKVFVDWWKEYKTKFKCSECSEDHPACIQFHHINDDKIANVSALRSKGSKELILAEINKCVPLCANCHFKMHWNNDTCGKKWK